MFLNVFLFCQLLQNTACFLVMFGLGLLVGLNSVLSTLQGTAVQELVMWHTAWLPERLREWTVGTGQSWVSSLHWSCTLSMLTAQRPRRRSTCPVSVSDIFCICTWHFENGKEWSRHCPSCFHLSHSSWRNPGLLWLDGAKPRQWPQQHGDQGQIQPIQRYFHHQWSQDLVGRQMHTRSLGFPDGEFSQSSLLI